MKRASRSRRGPLERLARASLHDSGGSMRRVERECAAAVAAAAEASIASLEGGGCLYFCGNGGSAADAQHLAAELAGRFAFDRPPLRAVTLTTNSSSLTAIANDYGYAQVFSRQLEGMARRGDVLVAITTSGGSASVIEAVEVARRLGLTVIGMTGLRGAKFAARCHHALVTPSAATPRIQEGHIAMGHALCELIEVALFGERRPASTRAAASRRVRSGAGRAASPRSGGGRPAPRAAGGARRRGDGRR
jgi:D-sedoheptulose 7-phosphate isomerase